MDHELNRYMDKRSSNLLDKQKSLQIADFFNALFLVVAIIIIERLERTQVLVLTTETAILSRLFLLIFSLRQTPPKILLNQLTIEQLIFGTSYEFRVY